RVGGASAGAGATSTGGKSAGGTVVGGSTTGGGGGTTTGGSAAGGVGGPYAPTCPTGGTSYAYPFKNPCLGLEERVTNLLSLLTDAEKVSLLTERQPAISRLGIAAFSTFTEGIHGLGWASGVSAVLSTQFPQASGLGETWDPDVLTQAFAQVGNEARVYFVKNKGQQVSLALRAPVVDLSRDPRAGRAEESLGEDPYLVGELGKALVRGLQGSDPRALQTAATMKHFLAYNQEQNRGNNNVILDDRNLREYYLVPFYETIVNAHGQSFMTSYNAVNGAPAVCSPLIKSVVIGEWGFDGMICTDANAMQAAYQSYKYYPSLEDAAAGTVKAGTPVILAGNAAAMSSAFTNGKLTRADMDAALAGNFRMRFRLGEFDPSSPYSTVDGNSTPWTSDAAKALARLVTQKSIVLLKNEGNLLPLDKSTLKSLAVIGPNADLVVTDWYGGKPPYSVSALAGIKAAVGTGVNVQYALDNSTGQAVTLATSSDAAIVVVGNHPTCGNTTWATCPSTYDSKEAVDRGAIDLKPEQVTLIQAVFAANPKTIVVDVSSFMQAITSVQATVPAIVHITHSSQELGNALADVLFGAYNPAGRTSVTWYKALTDIPAKNDYDIRKGRTYMYFQGTPLYPFGFGLSYTTFTYSALRLSSATLAQGGSVTVSVDVTNSGTRAGDEVVQLYVSYPTTTGVPRPIKQLQGFKRITLAPAETKTVALTLTRAQLAYWDATAKAFAVQPGTVHLMVGGSSVDKRSEADLSVQ
ncbi:MAG TPA: glycoside hydrolase family 3 C-terminal domain-containing protein, partial [Polyangia bacterium]|nr:glycoside hydrolase family 3 C-terminal domain-containing protein [Polyangia bacterium]